VSAAIESPPLVSSHSEAVRVLDDAAYFRWCRVEADKFYAALIAKRFPHLVAERQPAISTIQRRNPT
jgi:hypothetical protein